MERIRAADLLAGLIGLIMAVDFGLMDAPAVVSLSGAIVGFFAGVTSLYNFRREVRGIHGKERLSQANMVFGMWLIFLVLFWEIAALKELIAVFGAVTITAASTYASYYRQERLGRKVSYDQG